MLLLAFAAASALITLILGLIKVRWVKYTPALLALIFGCCQLYLSYYGENEGLQDIAYMLMAWMMFSGAIGSVITGLLLDRVSSKRRT